jgi:ribonuclease HII
MNAHSTAFRFGPTLRWWRQSRPHLHCRQTQLLVKGDAQSASIAAASILAKVSRDRYMFELDRRYPQYQFAKHKGYPTPALRMHCAAWGSDCHRRSF